MPKKVWVATHNGCHIRVENTWTRGAKLFIDDACQDTNKSLFSFRKSKLLLRAKVSPSTGEPFSVEVYFHAFVTVKAKICVNGAHVGGDAF